MSVGKISAKALWSQLRCRSADKLQNSQHTRLLKDLRVNDLRAHVFQYERDLHPHSSSLTDIVI